MSDPAPKPPSDLAQRTLVGIGLIVVALAALWAGGIAFWVVAVVAALFMMAEWSDLDAATPRTKRLAQYGLSVPLAIMAPIAAGPSFFALGLLAGAAFFVAAVTRRGRLGWGAIYVGLPVLALMWIRAQEGGFALALWTLSIVWATDIGAYFAGRAIGGPKLAPRISPSKTWAGLAGGVLSAGLVGITLAQAAGLPLRLAVASPLLAVLAQGGDLYESWLKRRAGVKDSGNILPGHGGFLDRLDGVVPVAPAAALLLLGPALLP